MTATKDKVLASNRGYLWQSFVDLNTAVIEEVGATLDWVKVSCPDLYEKLSVIEERLVFDPLPKGVSQVLSDIKEWSELMLEAISKREELRAE